MLILFGQVQVSLASGDLGPHEALGLLVVSRVVNRHRYGGTDRQREGERAKTRCGGLEFRSSGRQGIGVKGARCFWRGELHRSVRLGRGSGLSKAWSDGYDLS